MNEINLEFILTIENILLFLESKYYQYIYKNLIYLLCV